MGVTQSQVVNDVFTRISKVIDDSSRCSGDDDESDCEETSREMSPDRVEESKELCADLSLSLINKQIGAILSEGSSVLGSDEAVA